MSVVYYLLIYFRETAKRTRTVVSNEAGHAGEQGLIEDPGIMTDEEFEKVRDRYNRIGFEYMDVDTDDYDFDYDIDYKTDYDVESKVSDTE